MTSSIFMLIHSHYTLYDIGFATHYGSVECHEINTLFHFHGSKMQSHDIYKGPQAIGQQTV